MKTMYNHDSERYLIGALLQDAELQRMLPHMPDDLMHDPQHAQIYTVIKEMQQRKEPIELLSVSNRLGAEGRLETVGGTPYLLECWRYCPTTANIQHYITELGQLAAARAAYRMANTFCHRLMEGDELSACVEELRASLRHANQPKGKVARMTEVLSQTSEYIEAKMRGDITGLQTGLQDYDAFTGGLYGGEMTVIGARPAVGKSAFGMEIALRVANRGKRVLVCSREMNALQFGLRLTSSQSGINGMALKNGQVGDNQWEPIYTAMNELAALPIAFTFDSPAIEELHRVVAHEADTRGIDLLVVDYLQLMGTLKKRDKRYQEVGDVSRGIKEIAMEFGIPVIALAQVGRVRDSGSKLERAAICPVMSDLRESGNIEQDADNILFLHRPDAPSDPAIPERDKEIRAGIEAAGKRYVLVKIEKQRMGPTGKFGTCFDPERMRFTGLERSRP